MKDVHLAHGMQCVDCHFEIDVHGNGKLYGEPRNATTITCIDCHGTIDQRPTLITPATPAKSICCKRATRRGGRVSPGRAPSFTSNRSMSPDVRWEIPQTIDTIDPLSSHYNPKSAYAKTLRRDGTTGAAIPTNAEANAARRLAHDNSAMDCQICHTSWATSCFGCHLPMKANQRVRAKQIRRRHRSQLHHLQSAGRARRRLHARASTAR